MAYKQSYGKDVKEEIERMQTESETMPALPEKYERWTDA